jgi:hypothetical protein
MGAGVGAAGAAFAVLDGAVFLAMSYPSLCRAQIEALVPSGVEAPNRVRT